MPGKFPTDPTLIAALLELRSQQNLTNSKLVKLLGIPGTSETFLSKYLNDNLDREVPNFERQAFDVIKSIKERIQFSGEIFVTSVVRKMANAFDLIRKTGFISLITGEAGNGKTSGINHYLLANSSAVRINLNATTRDANKVEGLVFRSVDNRDWKSQSSRYDYLVERFRDSSRLLIVDNAQRLSGSGRQWLFDFSDDARCPIALVGNPELLDRIRTEKTQLSRIGLNPTYELEPSELPAAAARVATQFSDPQTAEAIADLCSVVAHHEGRLRAVRMTVQLMQELRHTSPDMREHPRKAFRAAHSRLVRNYALPSD